MITVVDYGVSNLHSVSKALESVGAEVLITSKPDDIRGSDRIVLPGVGSFAQGIRHLADLNLTDILQDEVIINKKPFLGICLGMQLTAARGYENGINNGLGWIEAEVVGFGFDSNEFKVPHMGWNDVEIVREAPLFRGIESPAAFYFVHSYHYLPKDPGIITGVCNHGGNFAASVSNGNIHLVQFHPEKSQKAGLRVLENFLSC